MTLYMLEKLGWMHMVESNLFSIFTFLITNILPMKIKYCVVIVSNTLFVYAFYPLLHLVFLH